MSEEHYKQRLRDLLSFARHKNECDYAKWQVADYVQKQYGTGYSAGAMPACTCGLNALAAVIDAEVGK